jgi:hypothetical protein
MMATRLLDVRIKRMCVVAGLALLVIGGVLGMRAKVVAAATTPTLSISPSPGTKAYRAGQSVTLSVGQNSLFSPNARIEILECGAPKGVLPIDDTTCDGNTSQGNSILVDKDGSFSDPAYTLYQLPDAAIGDSPDSVPVCDESEECVLYIGEDQNDFEKPKIFSPPFTFTTNITAASPMTNPASPPASSSTGHSSPPDAAVSLSGGSTSAGSSTVGTDTGTGGTASAATGTLAFTGAPAALPWLVGSGVMMLLAGIAGRRAGRKVTP